MLLTLVMCKKLSQNQFTWCVKQVRARLTKHHTKKVKKETQTTHLDKGCKATRRGRKKRKKKKKGGTMSRYRYEKFRLFLTVSSVTISSCLYFSFSFPYNQILCYPSLVVVLFSTLILLLQYCSLLSFSCVLFNQLSHLVMEVVEIYGLE